MEELKGNSHVKAENKPPKIGKVISGDVTIKKPSPVKKFIKAFVTESISDLKNKVIYEVIIPGVKSIVDDTVHTLLYPQEPKSRSRYNSSGSRTSYSGYFDDVNRKESRTGPAKAVNTFILDDIYFEHRVDADEVLMNLRAQLTEYPQVTVADVYGAIGRTAPDYNAGNKYGWTDLSGTSVIRVGKEYMINFPQPIVIDKL